MIPVLPTHFATGIETIQTIVIERVVSDVKVQHVWNYSFIECHHVYKFSCLGGMKQMRPATRSACSNNLHSH